MIIIIIIILLLIAAAAAVVVIVIKCFIPAFQNSSLYRKVLPIHKFEFKMYIIDILLECCHNAVPILSLTITQQRY